MVKKVPKILLFAGIGSAIPLLLLLLPISFAEPNGPYFDVVKESQASSHGLEVKYTFTERAIRGDGELDTGAVEIYENVVDTEKSCEHCTAFVYTPGPIGFTEITYGRDLPADLRGATKLSFFVMGKNGGEVVEFQVAGSAPNLSTVLPERFPLRTDEVVLTQTWQKVEIDLRGVDLSQITHPIKIRIQAQDDGERTILYIKHILFEDEPLRRPIPTERILN